MWVVDCRGWDGQRLGIEKMEAMNHRSLMDGYEMPWAVDPAMQHPMLVARTRKTTTVYEVASQPCWLEVECLDDQCDDFS